MWLLCFICSGIFVRPLVLAKRLKGGGESPKAETLFAFRRSTKAANWRIFATLDENDLEKIFMVSPKRASHAPSWSP